MVIDNFSRFNDEMLIAFDSDNNQYDININELDNYLNQNNCYEWSLDSVDHNGEHQQFSGQMHFNDWFRSQYAPIDLAAFIEMKNLKGKIDELINDFRNLKQ